MSSLKTKEQYTNIVDEIIKIALNVECPNEKAETLKKTIKDYELLVPVVGEFSAGKSTFLNSFIGRKVLSVAVTPETAVATELRYSSEEYAEVIIDKGESFDCKRISIEDAAKVEKDWRCVRLYLNAENLKKIEPLVMVDMPGFDSPRDDHNRAIASYLNRGVHYVVLTSVESGTVTASMKRQIQDIQNMGRGCSFFVSKANLRSAEDVKSVTEEVRDQVEDILGETVEVKSLGKDAGAELGKLLASIDPDALFTQVFKEAVLQLIDEQSSAVATKIAALKNDREKNKEAIREMEEAKEKLERKRDRLIAEARSNRYEEETDSITSSVGAAISGEIDRLVDMAMKGANGETISQEINSIVRSAVIPAVNKVSKGITEKISVNFQMELQSYQQTFSLFDNPEIVQKMGLAASQLGDMAKVAVNGISGLAKTAAKKVGAQAAYKSVVGAIGIATSFVNPLIEIAILFLPEILGFIFGSMSKSQQEQEQRENVRSQIMNAIPKIKRELRAKIEPELQKQSELAIEAISEQFNGNIEEMAENIRKANDELENNADVIEKMQSLEKAKVDLARLKAQV
ncbi:MAG: dynamin family protein [Fibrobacter sp.]|uniref:dynamin family protein n=1 Tax=Fibrobacter sp. TaxID=35828 RepID=UPI0025C2EF30|nr:dynamin family protein [Fibrobacter sp.]MBQ9227026.1 dynamin family protein [Fibrobacter sp.]